MKSALWPLALCLGFVPLFVAAQQQSVSADRVVVEDADTLLIDVGGSRYRVQLPGIDAPERIMNPKLQRDISRTGLSAEALLPLGAAAADALRRMLPDFLPYRLAFDPKAKDKYGRTPGDLVDARGRLLSLRLVEEGYAAPVGPMERRDPALIDAMKTAREARRGLWQRFPQATAAWAGL